MEAQLGPASDRAQTSIKHTSDHHQTGSLIVPSRKLNGTVLPSKGNNGIALSEFNVSALGYARWHRSQWISKEHYGNALKVAQWLCIHGKLCQCHWISSDLRHTGLNLKPASSTPQTSIKPAHWYCHQLEESSMVWYNCLQSGSMALLSTSSTLVPSRVLKLNGTALNGS